MTAESTDDDWLKSYRAKLIAELSERSALLLPATAAEVFGYTHRVREIVEQLELIHTDYLCNRCGLTCRMEGEFSGLVNHAVQGGFSSTPGNGAGALDDGTTYRFSLCEFCLDWLFTQFVLPVTVYDVGTNGETFRPAEIRVREDGWRGRKEVFYQESARREQGRNQSEVTK